VALYREFIYRGVEASEPSVGNSMWVTGLSDPDGYRLEFESPTDAPEETKLSELKG
jgi:lactoylglutathione lyase